MNKHFKGNPSKSSYSTVDIKDRNKEWKLELWEYGQNKQEERLSMDSDSILKTIREKEKMDSNLWYMNSQST